MPKKQIVWGWIAFGVSIGAYVPLFIGGWQHPAEINIASYCIWIILNVILGYSAYAQDFSSVWRTQVGFLVGNVVLVALALMQGGYTSNLGPSEKISVYGIVIVVSVWAAHGQIKNKFSPRILYLGMILVDLISIYPMLKQYLMPHEQPTGWMITAWSMFGVSMVLNFTFADNLFGKLAMSQLDYGLTYKKKKSILHIFEESAFSLENFILIGVLMSVMCR